MEDFTISMSSLVAYAFWVLSAVAMLLAVLFWDDTAAGHLGRLSLFLCGAAVTANCRAYHGSTRRYMEHALDDDGTEQVRRLR